MEEWDWNTFAGSELCKKWSREELPNLNAVMGLVKGRTAVVQAGGNIGMFPKRLAEEFSSVYTFEPDPSVYLSLVRNVPELNVFKFPCALGCDRALIKTSGERRSKMHMPDHEGITHVAPGQDGAIPTLKIDDLGLPICDLIYLDVEGYELNALKGATETLLRCRPVIAVEVRGYLKHYGTTAEELLEWIRLKQYEEVARVGADHVFGPIG